MIELPAMVVRNEEMLKLVLLIKKKKKVGETALSFCESDRIEHLWWKKKLYLKGKLEK